MTLPAALQPQQSVLLLLLLQGQRPGHVAQHMPSVVAAQCPVPLALPLLLLLAWRLV
jgi:hypothetical protein